MATAGMPPSATPSKARSTSNWGKLWAKAQAMVQSAPPSMAVTIMGLRPTRSDKMLLNTSDKASAAVDADRDRLLSAGVRLNSEAISGIRGCTQYKSANVEKPPNTMARLMRLKAGLPAWTDIGRFNANKKPW